MNQMKFSSTKFWIRKKINLIVYGLLFGSKPLGGSKVDSVFHPSEVNKMSTRNFWELSGKK